METKKSKYDTNPLDPEVAKEADEEWGEGGGRGDTRQVKGATQQVGAASDSPRSNIYSEAPTREFNNPPPDTQYPSVFVPPTYAPPSVYQPPAHFQPNQSRERPTSRTVAGIGFPEKWAMILPYAPYLGIVASIIELLLVPRKETRVRFHAAQGLALQLAIVIIGRLFWIVGAVTDSSLGGTLFSLASFIFLIISMIRVWNGEPHRIPPVTEPTHWFNERIEPRTKS
jgi:uncharacterized membrane protein